LVPLKNEGPELWTAPTPTIANAYGSSGTWDAGTQTATSSTSTISNTFPRFKFPVSVVAGKDYRITATLVVTDDDALTYYRLGGDGVVTPPAAVNGVITIDTTRTASTGAAVFELDFDSTIGPASVTIESLSIREVIAAPTNVADGFVEGDFSRTSGLTGDGATTYLDSGRANNADPQNDNHNAVFVTSLPSIAKAYIGAGFGDAGTNFIGDTGAATIFTRSRASSADTSAASFSGGMLATSRQTSDAYSTRIGTANETKARTSQTPYSANVFVFARNASGFESYTDATIAFYSIGTSLSLADLDTAVTNLINRLKFALLVGENPSGLDPDTIDYVVRGYEAGGSLE
jgi:hypothetical protein